MAEAFWTRGLSFQCARCSACCRHDPGFVFLSRDDLLALAGYFSLGALDLARRYCRPVDVGSAWRISLKEKSAYDCVLWDEAGCRAYEARPLQCRTYPFWPGVLDSEADWQAEARECPGVGRGLVVPDDEIARRLMARAGTLALEFGHNHDWESIDENTLLGR